MLVLARIASFFVLPFFLSSFCLYGKDDPDSFQVVAYNVENLFDVDGVSLYKDYQPEMYGMPELENKLDVISKVLKRIGGETGPDIILFQEIEVDRTPNRHISASEHLLKELKLNGLGPYYHRLGYNPEDSSDQWPVVHCLTLSKFPIKQSYLHFLKKARPILETTILVEGHTFTLFNNHWKSGASSNEMEIIRIQNAQVLHNRIDRLIEQDPTIDFLVGGDLNSHYNQAFVYQNQMKKTGINHVLKSRGTEPSGESINKGLYNLWYELAPNQRGSDEWRGKWGTLMNLLIPSSLYDRKGIRYVADSFQIEAFDGLNKIEGLEIPLKWSNELNGFGASDHFPISARFRTSGNPPRQGNNFPEAEASFRPINYEKAKKNAGIWNRSKLDPNNFGKTFRFSGIVSKKKPLTLKIGEFYLRIYSFDSETKKRLFSQVVGDKFVGYGYLSRYRGQWQLIVAKPDWID